MPKVRRNKTSTSAVIAGGASPTMKAAAPTSITDLHAEIGGGANLGRKYGEGRNPLRRILITVDVASIASPWLVVFLLSGGFEARHAPREALQLAIVLITGIVLVYLYSLHRARISSVRSVELVRLSRVAIGTAVVAYAIGLDQRGGRLEAVIGGVSCFVVMALSRRLYAVWLKSARVHGKWLRHVVIVGDIDEGSVTASYLDSHPALGYKVCGIVTNDPNRRNLPGRIPVLGVPADLVAIVRETGASGIVVCAGGIPVAERSALLRELMAEGVHIQMAIGLSGISQRRLRAQPLAHQPYVYIEPLSLHRGQVVAKRFVDLTLAPLLLIASAPVMLVAAILIKLEDHGPVLFSQLRVGRNGEPFTVHKLRTMVVDAEKRQEGIRHLDERTGPLFKVTRDPRTTRIGAFLRATSIDEIPQLINVLAGTMTLVGPRPALPNEVAQFDDELMLRLRVLPGVTGLWQTEARDDPSFESYRLLDIFYVDNWSISLDLAIIFGTATALISRSFRIMFGRPPPTVGRPPGPKLGDSRDISDESQITDRRMAL
jgi:exopolysaccharide biosynthesis polyprenyl glycosylphosphotransferase